MNARVALGAMVILLAQAAGAQHTRLTDGLALADLADGGLQYETMCERVPDLPPLPGALPPRRSIPIAAEVYGSSIESGTRGTRRAAIGHVRIHASPRQGCRWDLAASLVVSTRGSWGNRSQATLLFPAGRVGAAALFSSTQYGDDADEAADLQLDRETVAGVSYTTPNLYPVTVGLLARLLGDRVVRLDLRSRLFASAVVPINAELRPEDESPDILRRSGIFAQLHVLHVPVTVSYAAEETARFVAGRAWRRQSTAIAYRVSRDRDVWIVARRSAQGLSREPRDREWAVHVTKLVF